MSCTSSRAQPQARSYGDNYRPGRITETAIREFIPDPSAVEVYCCGPGITKYDREAARERGEEPTPRFLESTLAGLTSVGVTKKQIHRESYG